MYDLSFEDLVDAARQLQPELQAALVHALQATPPVCAQEDLGSILTTLASAGSFDVMETLFEPYSKYAEMVPGQALLDAMNSIATSWNEDLEPLAVPGSGNIS